MTERSSGGIIGVDKLNMNQINDPNRINNTEDDLKKIIQEQTALLRDIRNDIHSMKRAAMMSKIVNLVMFVIFFIAPIIVSAIFLPKLIQSFTSSLGGMYGTNTQGIDPFKLLTDPNALKQFQNQAQQK